MTAKEIIYRMLETYYIPNSDFRMVNAGEKAVEAAMLTFAQIHVEAALKAAETNVSNGIESNCNDHTPYYGPCVSCGMYDNQQVLPESEVVLELIKNAYPIENIK